MLELAKRFFAGEAAHKGKNFGNARMVRNYFEETMINQANRLAGSPSVTDAMLRRFVVEDLPKKFYVENLNGFAL